MPLVENSASHGRSSLERGEGGGCGKPEHHFDNRGENKNRFYEGIGGDAPFVPTKGLVLLGLNIALVAFAVRKVPTVGQAYL